MKLHRLLIGSFRESFHQIWHHKKLFAILYITQVVFFVVFSLVNINYQTRILEGAQNISDYLKENAINDEQVSSNLLEQKPVLGDDPLMIARNLESIISNFRLYLVYTFLLFVVFGSFAWAFSHKIAHRLGFEQLKEYFLKALAVLSLYLGLIFGFFFSIVSISIIDLADNLQKILWKYMAFFLISVVLLYFMLVSLSLMKHKLRKLGEVTLIIGLKKAHYVLFLYIIYSLVIAIPFWLLVKYIEQSTAIMTFAILLIIFSFVFGRILLINFIGKLEN